MINIPTVFVLGAGASEPYGLPLGNQLRLNILERYLTYNERSGIIYKTTRFGQPDIDEFISALGNSGLGSVDAFLERRPEFMDIGKAMMGIELLHGEVHTHLWQDQNNWLTYLYRTMIGNSLDQFAGNKVSFVTFNYDRSVEHFLFVSLKNTFGCSDEQAAEAVTKIPAVHLHGRLGHLPWQAQRTSIPWQGQRTVIEYGDNEIDERKMQIITRQIKVVHEELTDGRDKDFEQAKELLGKASRVYLLGFGFGARNVQRLGLADLAPRRFQGTAYGMTQREASNCSHMSGVKVQLFEQFQCLQFLREIAEFD